MEKRSRRSPSVKEKSNIETTRIPLDNFMTEFLSHWKSTDVDRSPKFVIKNSTTDVKLLTHRFSQLHGITLIADPKQILAKKDQEDQPIFHLTYENPKLFENLQKFECKDWFFWSKYSFKNILEEVSISVLDALYLTLNKYRTLTVLRLPNCGINAYGIVQIYCMLTDYNCLRDLNLDRNPNVQENYDLLCKSSGNLLYLSLQLCKITDEGVKKISDELVYADPPKEAKLLALNLSNNRIGDRGATEIARMLRTNRSLQSLILTGNRICDDGAALIIQELNISQLTHSEIVDLRRRKYDALILQEKKYDDVNRNNENEISKIVEDVSNLEILRMMKRKNKVSNKSKKSKKLSLSGRSSMIMLKENCINKSEKSSIIEIDHPFGKESMAYKGAIRTVGNFRLKHLNLSFNHLTGKTIKKLIECLHYQTYAMMSDTSRGLLYVIIQGNDFKREDDNDLMELEELLRSRQAGIYLSRSDDLENTIPSENNDL